MTRSSKRQEKRRLLLDDEELKPKTDPWDFFYGKAHPTGTKPSQLSPSLPHEQTGERRTSPSVDIENTAEDDQTSAGGPLSPPLPRPETLSKRSSQRSSDWQEVQRPIPHIEQLSPRIADQGISQNSAHSPKPEPDRNSSLDQAPVRLESFNGQDFGSGELTFEDFERAFKKLLAKADIKVCRLVFDQTYALGQATCILRAEDLAEQAGVSRRHLFRVLSELENCGFIKRGNIYNTPTKKGIEITFYPVPRIRRDDAARQFHYYDKDEN